MPSPFPGMNPYLENAELWSAVHSRLIVAIADVLADTISQDYRIEIEKRTYWSDETGEEISERYLEIREVQTGKVITAIEILSPNNKKTGEGREAYLRKRRRILQTQTHFVEIDLLRTNPSFLQGQLPASDYHILVSRSHERPAADLYAFSIRDRIPNFSIPLRLGELEPTLDLQVLVDHVYQRGRYDLAIDYSQSTQPRLNSEDEIWASSLLTSS
jgi:hypothetical protein